MLDEQPDGGPHGECAAKLRQMQEALRWCYSKLYKPYRPEDAARLDEIFQLLKLP